MPHPRGLPKTGGRKKGALNKYSNRLSWLAREVAKAGLPASANSVDLSPLDCLLAIMRFPAVEGQEFTCIN